MDEIPVLANQLGHAATWRASAGNRLPLGRAWNESGYANPEFDARLNAALPDVEKRKEIMADVEKILQESGIIIQPYWRKLYIHSSPSLKGHRMHPTLEHEFHAVWLDET